MTISEAITEVLSASHHGDQHFRKFLRGDDPEVVRMRAALVQLAEAVRWKDDMMDSLSILQAVQQYCHEGITMCLTDEPKVRQLVSLSLRLNSRRCALENIIEVIDSETERQRQEYEQKCREYMNRSKESDFID